MKPFTLIGWLRDLSIIFVLCGICFVMGMDIAGRRTIKQCAEKALAVMADGTQIKCQLK